MIGFDSTLVVVAFDGQVSKLTPELDPLGSARLAARECYFAHRTGSVLVCNSAFGASSRKNYIDLLDLETLEVRPLLADTSL